MSEHLEVWTNGVDTVAARNREDVQRVIEEHYGATFEQEGWTLDEFKRVPDDKPITINNFDGHDNKQTMTAAEWARRDGRCLLCSTEY